MKIIRQSMILRILQILVICVCAFCCNRMAIVKAEETFGDFEYELSTVGDGVIICGYVGNGGMVTIPEEINGKQVTGIDMMAFSDCKNITGITIPKTINSIGSYVLAGCDNLKTIVVDSDNTVYDSRDNCNAIISTYTNQLEAACGSTIIPDTVTKIGFSAFVRCKSLKSINIPKSVTSMREGTFALCSNLDSITVDPENKVFDSRDNCNAIIDTSTNTLMETCNNTVIPDSVECIGWMSFSGRDRITKVTIPENVKEIGHCAFQDCTALTDIVIPKNVTTMGEYVFDGCTGLKKVTLPDGITSIGKSMFGECTQLTTIELPDSVTVIEEYAFQSCTGITEIIIPKNVTDIGEYAFWNCSGLKSVTLPDGLKSIGQDAFNGCSNLSTINIPKSITTIDQYTFEQCTSLASVVIPEGVQRIENGVFEGCSALESVVFPESVTFIDRSSLFADCTSLKSIYVTKGSYADKYFEDSEWRKLVTYTGSGIKPYDQPEEVVTAPAKVTISSAKNSKKKSIVVKWKKVKNAKGYEVQYALNSKFTKSKKSKSLTKVSFTAKKLKKGKTYYVRVRAYNKKADGTKVNGKWSKVKKVKIKK